MKSTTMRVARFLPLLAVLALAPFGLWSCEDAGDEPGSATGPSTVYNPGTDYSKATIAASVSDNDLQPGDVFTVVVTYTDATGAVVTDAPLAIGSEATNYFSTPTNPSYTNSEGKASFRVTIDNDCPTGSYYFRIYTNGAEPLNGPSTLGSFGIWVGGGGVSSVTLKALTAAVTAGNAAQFQATATVTSDCTPVFYYESAGPGSATTSWTQTNGGNNNPNFFTVPVSSSSAGGTMTVVVRAYCQGNDAAFAESGTVSVTVSAVPPTITTPGTPTGNPSPSLSLSPTNGYSTTGATCSNGDVVEYLFAATGGTGTTFAWTDIASQSITWNAVGPWGVTVTARCKNSTSVTATSGSLSVTVIP